MKPLISKCSMIPAWHQLVPISGHVEESETARKLQLYATSIKTSVSTRLLNKQTLIISVPHLWAALFICTVKQWMGTTVVALASTTGFILAHTAGAQTACKRQRRRCLWLAIYFYTQPKKFIYGTLNSNEPAMYPKILEVVSRHCF